SCVLPLNNRSTTTSSECVGESASHLASPPIALLGKIALAGYGGFLPTRQATPIDIQPLPGRGGVMLRAATVLAIDGSERLFHLAHLFSRAGVQRLLDDRWLGTLLPPECRQEARNHYASGC